MIRDEATQAQVTAADPDASTWLAANAGSGKTRVLTDRVARLLLQGVLPEHILCLTYTKAAASEMQNRLFRRLGDWAMRSDDDLREELNKLGLDERPNSDFLREARTLFARAIETPGGLRIQTIHSFCSALLRRFPLEAGVSPQFKEMEDRAAQLLRMDIMDRFSDGPEAHLVADLAPLLHEVSLDGFLSEIIGQRDAFRVPRTRAEIYAQYGLAKNADKNDLLTDVFLGAELDLFTALIPHLKAGGKTDQKLATALAAITSIGATALAQLKEALLTKTGTVSKRLYTKKIAENAPDLIERLDQLAARLEEVLEKENAILAAKRDSVLHAFAAAFLPAYEAEKERRGWLDFDDLITRARDLLSTPAVAEWVLYRLDGGIDHILVDEAQDTSPVQWQVIEKLAAEFTSGQGARDEMRRTIFVVGDKKQSIYSFQGADPREFDRMRDEFAERLRETEAPLVSSSLQYSFRSAEPILRLVDNVFDGRQESGFSPDQHHKAFKDAMPGRVDLWPVVEKIKPEEDGAWYDPVDRQSPRHETVILAQRIAHFVKSQIDAQTPIAFDEGREQKARPVHAGDFLVLVRSRGRLFLEIIRACKQAGIPIAGADRLKVMAELAVKDIAALLRFLATPEDDLSLATALRSPLFGLSEQQLFTLAHHRGQSYLWQALRAKRSDFEPVLAVLDDLRGQTDFLRPYDLIERILTRHNGRKKLIGRLGPEAEDGVNALLQQALAYEQSEIPSLTGFLQWMQTDDLEIKRAPDAAGTMLRVMTVHGSKGLEAPIVILPDCIKKGSGGRNSLLTHDDHVFWKQSKAQMPKLHQEANALAEEADAQERDRLLYVALTRAEKWLVVAAAGQLGKDDWYAQVQKGMIASGGAEQTYDFGDWGQGVGQALVHGDPYQLDLVQDPFVERVKPSLPDQFQHAAPAPVLHAETRSPSDLGGAKALAGDHGDETEIAMARGSALHLLLEHLPSVAPEHRIEIAQNLLADQPDALDIDVLINEACATLDAPDLQRFWGQDYLAEVPVTAELPKIGRIHGIIDRLIVTPDHVIAVDFKSNRAVPKNAHDVPEGLMRQMAAYSLALQQIYPGQHIECGLIWTYTQTYTALPTQLMQDAFHTVSAS